MCESIKRAFEISAAGMHNIVLYCHDATLAERTAREMLKIMPENTGEEERPFRKIDGSFDAARIKAESVLSRHGILFAANINKKNNIDDLSINHTIAILCVSPCACGHLYDGICTCSDINLKYHINNLPGSLIRKADIHLPVRMNETKTIYEEEREIRKRIDIAVKLQKRRYQNEAFKANSMLNRHCFERYCSMDKGAKKLLCITGTDSTVKVARTIADLELRNVIKEEDIAEALGYGRRFLNV